MSLLFVDQLAQKRSDHPILRASQHRLIAVNASALVAQCHIKQFLGKLGTAATRIVGAVHRLHANLCPQGGIPSKCQNQLAKKTEMLYLILHLFVKESGKLLITLLTQHASVGCRGNGIQLIGIQFFQRARKAEILKNAPVRCGVEHLTSFRSVILIHICSFQRQKFFTISYAIENRFVTESKYF